MSVSENTRINGLMKLPNRIRTVSMELLRTETPPIRKLYSPLYFSCQRSSLQLSICKTAKTTIENRIPGSRGSVLFMGHGAKWATLEIPPKRTQLRRNSTVSMVLLYTVFSALCISVIVIGWHSVVDAGALPMRGALHASGPNRAVHVMAAKSAIQQSIQKNKDKHKDKSVLDMSPADWRREVTGAVPRLPSAVVGGVKAGCQGFVSTLAIIMPVGMLWHIKTIRTPNAWMGKGFTMGRDWGRTSAFFLGGEIFTEKLRGKKDRWNSYVGSGLGSAALRLDEGPVGMFNGFIFGAGFLYVFDKFGAGAGSGGAGAGAGAGMGAGMGAGAGTSRPGWPRKIK